MIQVLNFYFVTFCNCRVSIDRLDAEILLLKKELIGVQELRASKEKSLAKAQSDLESLLATKQSLDLELEQVSFAYFK